jgi:hypothetical protein
MKKTIFGLSIAGFLFAGCMSGIKLFTQTCAFKETCPLFFGIPACYFGLVIFAGLLFFSGMLVFSKMEEKQAIFRIFDLSLAGIIFAGFFSLRELPLLLSNGFGAYALGLPTCTLGLISFVLIFILSAYQRFGKK